MKSTPDNSALGEFTGPGEVRLIRLLPGPIERIWDYLTDPDKRSRWFAGGPLEPRVGGKVTFHVNHRKLVPAEPIPAKYQATHGIERQMTGTVTRYEPPRVLAFTFDHYGESEATFELSPQGNQVLLVLTHRGKGGDLSYLTGFASGWHTHLVHLLALLEGKPQPPFWALHDRMLAEYEALRKTAVQPSSLP